ncbi:MAG: hypothetical protein ABIH11_01610 [Candidatus Altiarchaeota archaeon]
MADKKGFFGRILDKIDGKMKDKSKKKGSCCKSGGGCGCCD